MKESKAKLEQFMKDERLVESVHSFLLTAFLKPKPRADVQMLAASRVAIDLLEEAWRELSKYKTGEETETDLTANVGL